MARHRDLLIGLEMLTEGAGAALPRAMRAESLETASETLRKRSHGWTMGPGIQGVGLPLVALGFEAANLGSRNLTARDIRAVVFERRHPAL